MSGGPTDAQVAAEPAAAQTGEGLRSAYILAKLRDRLRASELLGRSHGMFSDKVQLEVGNSLADILERAERLRLGLKPKDQGDGQAHHG